MNQIHPNSPYLDSTIEVMIFLFDAYDLKYQIDNLDIIEISDEEAIIRVTQTTTKISGSEFRDNRVVAVHTLKKYQGQWKFLSTEIRSIEYLD